MPNNSLPYKGREQTAAKHFILRRYLQELAFKLLLGNYRSIAYIDGFSGPWESRTSDYSDTSFMIAINVLKDVQNDLRQRGKSAKIQCVFVEKERKPYAELANAVMAHSDPGAGFSIKVINNAFEESVDQILHEVSPASFALTFIDPTGWTGYELPKIAPLLRRLPGELLLNFMADFYNRFTASDNAATASSFQGTLGEDWRQKLNPHLARIKAIEELFLENIRERGEFEYVLSTPIRKLSERTHFCIVYGTRSRNGLSVYRDVEFSALKEHDLRIAEAKEAIREERSMIGDMFYQAGMYPDPPIDEKVKGQIEAAKGWVLHELQSNGSRIFIDLWPPMIANFMLRETNAKKVCVELAKEQKIRASWRDGGSKRRTPNNNDLIELC